METVLLLRSYGDFVIALYHLNNTTPDQQTYKLVASKHLEQLHQALFPLLSPAQQQIVFIDFGIEKHILSGFTHRYLFTKHNLKELKILQEQMNGIDSIVLEQERRAWLIKMACKRSISTVHSSGNIYDSWATFFDHKTSLQTVKRNYKTVLIFPDSRLRRKQIPEQVLLNLEQQFAEQGIETNRAYFKNAPVGTSYQNFKELVQLIQEAAYIISSDSLPAHIAQLLQKPHTILYAKEINHEWVTPFARENNTSYIFNDKKLISQLFKLGQI
jgi:hypothetical protein